MIKSLKVILGTDIKWLTYLVLNRHTHIPSRVGYCNGLLTDLPINTIRHLQLILNAAARVVSRTKGKEHITPVLKSLH